MHEMLAFNMSHFVDAYSLIKIYQKMLLNFYFRANISCFEIEISIWTSKKLTGDFFDENKFNLVTNSSSYSRRTSKQLVQ